MHDALHGFRIGRGIGTVTMEEKLTQQLVGLVHETLFQVFIDVRKSYDSLDRGICMEILRVYGLGNNLHRLLKWYWDKHAVVPKAGKFFGRPFGMVTQD